MRRLVGPVAIALGLALAGCGGTAWSSTQVSGAPKSATAPKPNKPKLSAKAAKAAAVEAAAEKPLVDAMVKGATKTPSTDPNDTPKLIRCVAQSLVHGYGAAAFVAAGLAPNALLNPDVSLDGLPAPTDAQIDAVGGALQACKATELMAPSLALSLHSADPATVACFKSRLRTADARRFLVLGALGRHPDLLAAHSIIGIISDCVDLPTLVLRASGIDVDPTTRACILDAMQGNQAALMDFMALQISNTDPSFAEQSFESVSIAINQCRPSARTGFTVPSG